MAQETLTIIETLELTVPFDEYTVAVRAFVNRAEAEGIRALAPMQVHNTPGTTQVGLMLHLSDQSKLLEHVQMIDGWDEFKRYAGMSKVRDLRVFGVLPPEIEAWLRKYSDALTIFTQPIVGFVRPPQ